MNWGDFNQPKVADPLDAARRRIAQHRILAAQVPVTPIKVEEQAAAQIYTLRTAIHSAVVNTIKAENLPRYSTQTMREPHPFLLRVVFEPSAKHGLGGYFAAYCQGTIVDPASFLHELSVSACVSPSRESVPAEPDKTAPNLPVKGQIIEQDVRTHIQKCLLLAYAEALDNAPTAPKAVHWLNLGGKV